MAILFRKKFRLNKLISLNLYKKSASIQLNLPCCKIGHNFKKGTYISGSLPKTGVYGIKYIPHSNIIIPVLFLLLALFFIFI